MYRIIILLFIIVIKIYGWELVIRDFQSSSQTSYNYYFDVDYNRILFRSLYNGEVVLSGSSPNETYFRSGLANVLAYNGSQGYKSKTNVMNQFRNNLNILDSFYRLGTNVLLNFLYNPNFKVNNYINYNNYELLYNQNGLVVESIVDGVWAGLYDDDQKNISGILYNSKGVPVYNNGVKLNESERLFFSWNKLLSDSVNDWLKNVSSSMILDTVLVVFLTFCVLFIIITLMALCVRFGWGYRGVDRYRSGNPYGKAIHDKYSNGEISEEEYDQALELGRGEAMHRIRENLERRGLL